MPRDLTIRNFKLFRELSLPRLGDVNLIVGRNNTGKTALLEALMLHAAQGHPSRIFEVLWSRDEVLQGRPEPEPRSRREAQLRLEALFHGSPDDLEGVVFEFVSNHPTAPLKVAGTHRPTVPPARGASSLPLEFGEEPPSEEETVPALEVWVADKPRYVVSTTRLSRLGRFGRSSSESNGAVVVPIGGLDEQDIAAWWDMLTLTEGEQGVYDCLRLLAPVERLSLVERPGSSYGRMAMVKLQGQSRPVPLRSLGDGVRRVFQFALALQRTLPGDLLLIDEIENGVHYTALPALWSVLIKAARAKKVQVFATTHSWDCVLGFQQATAQESATASLIKLYREGEDVHASTFDESELAEVAREEIEVR